MRTERRVGVCVGKEEVEEGAGRKKYQMAEQQRVEHFTWNAHSLQTLPRMRTESCVGRSIIGNLSVPMSNFWP